MTQILLMDLILVLIAILLAIADYLLVSYGECKITINRENILKTQGGNNLLSYFTEKKIFIPSACGGKATCGHCKVKILSGAGSILPTEEVFVSPEERRQGIRLACQVKIKQDIELFIPEYLLKTEEFEAEVIDTKEVTYDIKYLRLHILKSKTIEFKPGQYIQLKIPGTDEYRAYSIASSPNQRDEVELIIRLVPGGLCSTYVHKVLVKNDNVIFTGPFGDFYLHEDSPRDIVAIGGGCGMAPIRSILYYLAHKGMPRKLLYFFGARAKRDLFFTEELRKLESEFSNFTYVPALSEPKHTDKWEGEVGLITQVAERYIKGGNEKEAYLCGPPPMIDAALRLLPRKGINPENIYYDKF